MRAHRSRAVLALVAGGSCPSCGEPGAVGDVATETAAIVGGRVDIGDPAVVALLVRTVAGEEGLCSGVVVAPRVVLTAAHCVAPEAVGRDASFTLVLGSDLGAARATTGASVAVDRVRFDPEFALGPLASGHDIGLAITAADLPIAPLAFDPPPELSAGNPLRLVGYGVSSPDEAESAGQKRDGVVPLESYDSLFLYPGSGVTPCDGDSGGPALVASPDGAERVAGIMSFAREGCGSTMLVTNLSSYLPFVRAEIVAAMADGPEPSEPAARASSSCQVASPAPRGSGGWPAALVGAAISCWVGRLGRRGAAQFTPAT